MFELSGVNYEEVLEQGDSILVRVIASSSYRGFELSGLYCNLSLEFTGTVSYLVCFIALYSFYHASLAKHKWKVKHVLLHVFFYKRWS